MEVLINSLFGGEFINDNLGHEIIDFFKSDDGSHYLYIVSDGILGNNRDIDVLLLVERTPDQPNKARIIAKASGITLLQGSKENGVEAIRTVQERKGLHEICYGGVPLKSIFPEDFDNAWVTLKASSVVRPKYPLYVTNDERLDNNPNTILINGDPLNQAQRKYLTLNTIDDLYDVINRDSLWEKESFYQTFDNTTSNDENILSQNYPKMVEEFTKRINNNRQ